MKVSIYEDLPVEDKEQEFFLKLKKRFDFVELILVKADGEEMQNGTLLRITKKMELDRFGDIDNNLGLPLVKGNRLKIVGETE